MVSIIVKLFFFNTKRAGEPVTPTDNGTVNIKTGATFMSNGETSNTEEGIVLMDSQDMVSKEWQHVNLFQKGNFLKTPFPPLQGQNAR